MSEAVSFAPPALRTLAHALGGDVIGQQVAAPGPGHSRKDRSLIVRPSSSAKHGFVVHSHAGDDWRTCRDHVCDRLGISQSSARNHDTHVDRQPALEVANLPASPPPDLDGRIRCALRIWREGTDIQGSIAECYLLRRALPLGLPVQDLRFHPRLRREGKMVPGLVALMRDIETNQPCGVHRTFLTPDGAKLDRRMLGRGKGAAIKLDANEDVTLGLTIGEGVETVMSGRIGGFSPAWALGSADAIAYFPVLDGIEALTILAETDDTGANKKAVHRCARRWLEAGKEVLVVTPKLRGDLNDVLMEVSHAS